LGRPAIGRTTAAYGVVEITTTFDCVPVTRSPVGYTAMYSVRRHGATRSATVVPTGTRTVVRVDHDPPVYRRRIATLGASVRGSVGDVSTTRSNVAVSERTVVPPQRPSRIDARVTVTLAELLGGAGAVGGSTTTAR
jgi:hypothetical protein